MPASGEPLRELVAVMDQLRRSCPWDAEQTHRSLAKYLLEEAYETLDAIETGDADHLAEELGDLLLQVLFHARIASEQPNGFDIDEVAELLTAKLVSRHPHVFADAGAGAGVTASDVQGRWEEIKAAEKGRASVLDGIPTALPALAFADKLVARSARVGVDPGRVADEVGGVGGELLGAVVAARRSGIDPEQALRDATRELRSRIVDAEARPA